MRCDDAAGKEDRLVSHARTLYKNIISSHPEVILCPVEAFTWCQRATAIEPAAFCGCSFLTQPTPSRPSAYPPMFRTCCSIRLFVISTGSYLVVGSMTQSDPRFRALSFAPLTRTVAFSLQGKTNPRDVLWQGRVCKCVSGWTALLGSSSCLNPLTQTAKQHSVMSRRHCFSPNTAFNFTY